MKWGGNKSVIKHRYGRRYRCAMRRKFRCKYR